MTYNNLDEKVKHELGNLEAPYSTDDWEKVAAVLSNEKSSKGVFSNKINFSIKPDQIPSFKLPKITTSYKVIIGVAVSIGIIIMLFQLFDGSSSGEQNTHKTTKIESQGEHGIVKEPTVKTVAQQTVSIDSVPQGSESIVQQSTVQASANIEKNADGTVKKGEAKILTDKKIRKVKMEIEEIEEGGTKSPKPSISVVKRKRSKDSTESNQIDNSKTSIDNQVTPSPVTPEPEISAPPTNQETVPESEDVKKEGRKKKRQKSAIDEEDGPKSFRELDSIH